jgi:hypothetical protein
MEFFTQRLKVTLPSFRFLPSPAGLVSATRFPIKIIMADPLAPAIASG